MVKKLVLFLIQEGKDKHSNDTGQYLNINEKNIFVWNYIERISGLLFCWYVLIQQSFSSFFKTIKGIKI
jgi:hypothetical protein